MYVLCVYKMKQTYNIRLSSEELALIRKKSVKHGLQVSDVARLAVTKTIQLKKIPAEVQTGRTERRDQRINFKIEKSLVQMFSEVLANSDITMSDLFRHYLLNPENLFRNKQSTFKHRKKFDPKDFYQTPTSITKRLLEAYEIPKSWRILEPAAGQGAIANVLTEAGYSVTCYDKYFMDIDFFEQSEQFDCVITNPPFSQAADFVSHAMKVAEVAIFLLPLDFLHSKTRLENLYTSEDFHCSDVFILVRRPLMTQELQDSYKTGSVTFAWFIFKHGSGRTSLHHIDNSEDVR